jgi:hypothetical protein
LVVIGGRILTLVVSESGFRLVGAADNSEEQHVSAEKQGMEKPWQYVPES